MSAACRQTESKPQSHRSGRKGGHVVAATNCKHEFACLFVFLFFPPIGCSRFPQFFCVRKHINITRGASARRADARLASRMPVITEDVVHRQIEAVNATVLLRGTYIKTKSCLNEEKENTGWNQIQGTSNNFCHPAHDDEQHQQLLQQQHRHRAAATAAAALFYV